MNYYRVTIWIPRPDRRWIRFGMRSLLILMTLVCLLLGSLVWWQSEAAPARTLAILGPVTSGVTPIALNPPSDREVIRAVQKVGQKKHPFLLSRKQNPRIVKEKIADYVDPPRVYPLVGTAQQHHAHYKCTIYYERPCWSLFSAAQNNLRDVVFVDHTHLHIVDSPDGI